MDLSTILARRADFTPDKPTLIFEEQPVSYSTFCTRIAQTAGALTSLGVTAGNRVAVLAQNHPALLELLFACARLGAILVPLQRDGQSTKIQTARRVRKEAINDLNSESAAKEGRRVTMQSSSIRIQPRNVLFATLISLWSVSVSGCGYNSMVSMREEVKSSWAQVENQLKRRTDLIDNLVEVTKGYAGHEKSVFENIANARARIGSAGSRGEQIDAANEMSSAISRLLVITENYPQLKADAQFARLSDELAGTENRIATERRRYNEVVQAYNTYIKKFPAVLYSGWFGFQAEKYFEVPQEEQKAPKVKF